MNARTIFREIPMTVRMVAIFAMAYGVGIGLLVAARGGQPGWIVVALVAFAAGVGRLLVSGKRAKARLERRAELDERIAQDLAGESRDVVPDRPLDPERERRARAELARIASAMISEGLTLVRSR